MRFAIIFRFTVLHFEKQLVASVKYGRIRFMVGLCAIHIKSMLSQSFFRKKDPYLLEHFFAAVNDLIGHADAFVAEGLGLDAVVSDIDPNDVATTIDHLCQDLVAFGDGIQIIVDLHLGPPVFPHIKHGIQRQQHPIPQHPSCLANRFFVFIMLDETLNK